MRMLIASLVLIAGCAHSQAYTNNGRLSSPVVAPHTVDTCVSDTDVCQGFQMRRLSRTGPIMMGPE